MIPTAVPTDLAARWARTSTTLLTRVPTQVQPDRED